MCSGCSTQCVLRGGVFFYRQTIPFCRLYSTIALHTVEELPAQTGVSWLQVEWICDRTQ